LAYLVARLPSLADAEDALADVFLKAMRLTDAGDRPGAGWLFTVARRAVADFYRERSRALSYGGISVEAAELTPAGKHAEPEHVTLRAEAHRELWSLIARLPEEQRDALALRFAGGLRSAAIAAIIGKSDEATRALLSRAVRRLREEWTR
jgi:RNA polymerase sigma-70 factor (ECF subfamily)